MGEKTIGIAISAPDATTALANILRAEEMGIGAVWLTSGGGGGDPLPILAAAASHTERILLGTSIVQTWSRHPVAMAQQAQVIASLAPGRFRLGVGPGHKQAMEQIFGADFRAPLGHLREYLDVLKGLLQQGSIDMDGHYYSAHAGIAAPVDVPVLASALRPRSFEVCGAHADGAISWVCPHQYLWDQAIPALQAGADGAGRPNPSLFVHAPVCVDEDGVKIRAATRQRLGSFPRTTFYAQMFTAAGFPDPAETGWTDEMLDSVVVSGDEAEVADRLKQLFDQGASEVLATVVPVGDATEESAERTMKMLAELSAS